MAISAIIAQSHLDSWLAADLSLSTGKEHWMNGRKLVQEDASEIRKNIEYWCDKLQQAQNPNSSGIGVTVGNWRP